MPRWLHLKVISATLNVTFNEATTLGLHLHWSSRTLTGVEGGSVKLNPDLTYFGHLIAPNCESFVELCYANRNFGLATS